MKRLSRVAAFAAAGVVGLQTADAGFVYASSSRAVSAVSPSQTDNKSTAATGNWFGSAFAAGSGVSALANQGSDLATASMSLVGAGQAIGAVGASASASSAFDVSFVAVSDDGSSSFDINWIIGLSQNVSAGGNSAVFIKLTDVTTNTVRLMLSNNTTASGTLSVVSGRTYRLEASAASSASGAGNGYASFNGSFTMVPAPGAITLAGLSVLGMGRSRRRR